MPSCELTDLIGRSVYTTPHHGLCNFDVSMHIEANMSYSWKVAETFKPRVWGKVTLTRPTLFPEHSLIVLLPSCSREEGWLAGLGQTWPRTRTVFAVRSSRESDARRTIELFQGCLGWSWCDRCFHRLSQSPRRTERSCRKKWLLCGKCGVEGLTSILRRMQSTTPSIAPSSAERNSEVDWAVLSHDNNARRCESNTALSVSRVKPRTLHKQ